MAGGIIARLMVSSSGDSLWGRLVAEKVHDKTRLERIRQKVAHILRFDPLPQVDRVVFIAAPHRGTDRWRRGARRLGAPHARLGPGMHWRFPWPVDRVDVLKTTSVSKVGVGFALPEREQETAIGMELLTGDTNILSIALVLQYVIRDPADFLLHVEDTRALIGGLAESVLTQVLAGMSVDEVLTTGRLAIQDRVKIQTQELLDRYRGDVPTHYSGRWRDAFDRTDAFTLVGSDARRGKLTLFASEGPREQGATVLISNFGRALGITRPEGAGPGHGEALAPGDAERRQAERGGLTIVRL